MPDDGPKLIWERLQPRPTSRKLDYDRIVRTTMALADARGIEAVSMRNVADALRVGTMSLYRYVDGKDDLLDLILDAAYGEIPLPELRKANWVEKLRRTATESRRVMRSHPWLGSLVSRRPTLGPNYLRWFEYLLAASAEADCTLAQRVQIIGTMWAYLSGCIAYELGEIETDQKYDLNPAKKRKIAKPYLSALLAGGQFPHLGEFVKSDLGEPNDRAFADGLEIVLSGVQHYAAKNVKRSPGRKRKP